MSAEAPTTYIFLSLQGKAFFFVFVVGWGGVGWGNVGCGGVWMDWLGWAVGRSSVIHTQTPHDPCINTHIDADGRLVIYA